MRHVERQQSALGPGAEPSRLALWADRWVPVLVLSPSVAVSLVFVYGFMLLMLGIPVYVWQVRQRAATA